jgi:methionyl-tRNA synthetase
MERFKASYNAGLANGLGNLTSRIMKMASDNLSQPVSELNSQLPTDYVEKLNEFNVQRISEIAWHWIGEADRSIQENQPFKLVKTNPEEGKKMIEDLVSKLWNIACMTEIIIPETSIKIKELIKENKSPESPLFLRKD